MASIDNRPLRVAVATSDGVHVDLHFGRASAFRIYEIRNKIAVFLESRETGSLCGELGHDNEQLKKVAIALEDCRFIVSVQVGQPISQVLEPTGFTFLNSEGEVSDMLGRIARSPLAQHIHRKAQHAAVKG